MSQGLTKTSPMHDIPLSVEEPGDAVPNAEKLANKSNSLRRFFKMPHKKTGEGQLSGSASEAQVEKASAEPSDLEAGDKPKQPQRFHLRMGNISKYDSPALANPTSTSASCSKSTLKSSISSYWNTVFKRNHSSVKKSRSTGTAQIPKDNDDNDDDDDDEEEANETEIREEVHTLPISEESSEETSKS